MTDHVAQFFEDFDVDWHPDDDWRGESTFKRLAQQENWPPWTRDQQYARLKLAQKRIVHDELNNIKSATEFQTLCSQVGIEKRPWSETECYRLLSDVYVNVVDLIQVRRHGEGPVTDHGSLEELRTYTQDSEKFCPAPATISTILGILLRNLVSN